MPRLWIDIETIPTQRTEEIERIKAEVEEHNAQLARPHPAAKVAELVDEAWRKTALDGAFGEVVCIGFALDGAPPSVFARLPAASERQLLEDFAAMLGALSRPYQVSGHNVVGFDRPFLRQRALVHGLRLPAWFIRPVKPWDAVGADTMLAWTGGQVGKGIALDRLCRALGLPGKDGLDGSMVWDAIRDGKLDDVARYCAGDVERARACGGRMFNDDGGDDV